MVKDGSALNSKDTFNQNSNQIDDDNCEDFGKFEFQTESLLSLVQPELLSLSQYWLAALRDHALLSLPPGINSFCAVYNFLNYLYIVLITISQYFIRIFQPITS